ncbi:GNAT family N-acetyltransferase [Diaminobutyricibacter tongyongensis]|uniref:GNAT family N-acetyltransferase n=1 Tax=Leifsonia tongyongensis TaxID=1268043 RepID=A0A6L9XYP8_9MICO|nr:GNAT family N-acetyltransferase [Diaminobutyricibacter tongyongensis]NEN06551.1 GNAT family N-acetyltransferase [Diaminobutyricibacter tongyongensis]
MTTTVRRVDDGEFFTWLDLYAGYGEFYDSPLTDEKAVLVWSWLTDPTHELEAYFALDDADEPVGLAHVRVFSRPLAGSRGLFLDDLYVAPDARGQGAATAILETLRTRAQEEGLSVVRWITAADNAAAQRVYDRVAEKTEWVTYDLVP